MSRFIAKYDVQCTVLTLDIELDQQRIQAISPATVISVPCIWKRFYIPLITWDRIRHLVGNADVIHLMGHWSVLNALVYIAIRRAKIPYVVCPAGALPLFGRSRFLKRLYNLVVGNSIIRNASAWIAVTTSELSHFNSYGVPTSKVTIIPNGVSEDTFPIVDTNEFLAKHALSEAQIILFMGRLNPIKGPDLLLKAFLLVCHHLSKYHLVFAGPDGGKLSELRVMAEQHDVIQRVHFLGYVSGKDKAAIYRCAKLLVIPSRQEAMSIVALESGICGTPVLLTDQCGFSNIRSVDPRLEVPATVEGIAKGLTSLLADTETLDTIAPIWRDFVNRHYSWNAIVPVYINLYNGILARQVN
jgi:glycosyltransferase involved in cell wall biosynthesis